MWLNPTVAKILPRGRLFCLRCADVRDDEAVEAVVDCGNGALLGETCDGCALDMGALYDPRNRSLHVA